SEKINNSLTFNYQGKTIDLGLPWKRIKWEDILCQTGISNWRDKEAVLKKAGEEGIELTDEDRGNVFEVLDKIFKKKIQPQLINPTFIYQYPVEISPLAKLCPDRTDMVERFELFIGGLEIANAYSELNDPVEQRRRFLDAVNKQTGNKEKMVDEDYIEALEYGMPPAGGLGIGIDRLVMLLTNSSSIREVIFFPLLRPKK
ncbi:MAG: lysine--tRNA ligase, partial [Candidatus Omnitrophica bacterium]|nr:lysine--tRNA ligase [Candidatus Omnitrophota bacterium]